MKRMVRELRNKSISMEEVYQKWGLGSEGDATKCVRQVSIDDVDKQCRKEKTVDTQRLYIFFFGVRVGSGGIFPECSPTRDNYVYIISRASIASKARIVIAVR